MALILDHHKLLYHRDRLDAWRRGERIAPITIDCALTRSCTYRCIYCYGQLQANRAKPMSQYAIFRFLDDAAEIGVKAVSFVSDGESTCSPFLYDAILRGKSNGLDMAIGTNGYLLDDERLHEILPALTYIRFNISAAEPSKYSTVHGCTPECYEKVLKTIKKCVRIKKEDDLSITIGMQMVFLPDLADQVIPLAKLGSRLGVDYLVIKHCSDDELGTLGVKYDQYFNYISLLQEAENQSEDDYLVKAKWSKILSRGLRRYRHCYGPVFMMQFSGSGLVAPCGMLFNDRYKKFHIGNIVDNGFKDIWKSERYWKVLDLIASDRFDPRTQCGTLCLQHHINEFLWDVKETSIFPEKTGGSIPQHVNFV